MGAAPTSGDAVAAGLGVGATEGAADVVGAIEADAAGVSLEAAGEAQALTRTTATTASAQRIGRIVALLLGRRV